MSRKSALILGVSGQDGSLLAKFLLEKGYTVIGQTRSVEGSPLVNLDALGVTQDIDVRSADLMDQESVTQLIDSVDSDEIYNLSGQSSVGSSFLRPAETFKSHVLVVLNVLEAIRKSEQNTRFFNAGSGECFGETAGSGADEDSPFSPLNPYAISKVTATMLVANYRNIYGIYGCTGFLFNHESHLRPEAFVTQKIVQGAARIASGDREKLRLGNLDIRRDWGRASEYVDAMWRIVQQEVPEDFVIATGKSNSLQEFVSLTFQRFGLSWQDHVVVDHSLFRASDIHQNVGNPSKAAKQLEWRAMSDLPALVDHLIEG